MHQRVVVALDALAKVAVLHKLIPFRFVDLDLVLRRNNIIRDARVDNVGKFQSCMVSKLRIIFKRIVWHIPYTPPPSCAVY